MAGAGAAVSMAGCLQDDDPDAGDDEDWEPAETIRYIVPYDEGGGTDVYARGIVESLTDAMDQDIQVDNVPGGGGLNGFGELYGSEPDGHTIAGSATPLEVPPQMLDDPGFDQRELEGIANIGRSTWCLIVNEEYEGEVETFDDVREMHNSGEWDSIGIQEPGSPQDIMTLLAKHGEGYAEEYDWQWEDRVQYTGTGPIAEAVTSGEVPCGIGTDAGTEPDVSAGGVYPVCTFWSEGTEVYPDIPSVTDEGYPEMDFISGVTRGLYAPPETPEGTIEELSARVEEATEDERYEEWSEDTGNPIFYEGPEEANAAIDDAFEEMEELEIVDLIEEHS
ncbi:tripartite tricarboxylate transporter substrate-binding protein [Natronococcus sp. A-GB1]|uniref:Bug family tripartite tricarboxylate transporter substrate binding protein n=1 Tax=Natronococcus sp. A-GB1 TaxID=3037648 RepID=UPI0031F315E1